MSAKLEAFRFSGYDTSASLETYFEAWDTFNEPIPNKFIYYDRRNTRSNVFVNCMNVNKDVLVYFT